LAINSLLYGYMEALMKLCVSILSEGEQGTEIRIVAHDINLFVVVILLIMGVAVYLSPGVENDT